jgi:hypothetical protein
MKINNIFAPGTIDKDNDSRFVQVGTLVDAENFLVAITDGSDRGVGKTVIGNVQKTDFEFDNGKTIGSGKNESENKIYYFVKAADYDYIIEFDTLTELVVVVLQSTTGTRLNFREGERILNIDVFPSAEGNGTIILFSGDSNPPRVINVERAKTWGIDGFTPEEIMLIKPPSLFQTNLNPTISSENVESNNLTEKFLSFAYRFRYKDGYYSCASTWSKYNFVPGPFDLDFESFVNYGMQNVFNGVNLSFNTGPREVDGIDLLFKYSDSNSIYVIDRYIKEDQGWTNNQVQTIQFNNSKIYRQLPESEYFRSFDNIPEQSTAQALIGNRVAYGNYLEGKNLIDDLGNPVIMDYTLDLVANDLIGELLTVTIADQEYDYEAPDPEVNVVDGKMSFDLTGFELIAGAVIFINFSLESTPEGIIYEQLFSYFLEDDYTNVTDLFANSDFLNALEVQFSDFFENNGGIVPPDDTIVTTVLKGFDATNVGNVITITFPVVKYEIDVVPDPNTFVYDYFFSNATIVTYQNIGVATSLKSRRSYEICMIYRDLQGRKTTALISDNNTLFVPNANMLTQNQIKVTVPITQRPPAWATTYKFGIKENKGPYEQIMASVFFVEDEYRWIKLDGENKNKVKENDVLIVKKDSGGPIKEVIKVTVLEVKLQPKDFIEGNQDENAQDIIEPAGLYMKIKPKNFEIDYDEDEFLNYTDYKTTKSGKPNIYLGGLEKWDGTAYIDIPLNQGSNVNLRLHNYESDGEQSLFEKTWTVQNNYASFEAWWTAEIQPTLPLNSQIGADFTTITFVRGFDSPFGFIETGLATDNLFMKVVGTISGAEFERSKFNADLNIRNIDGFFIFETESAEINSEVYFETPEVYNIVNGQHQFIEHLLTQTFNCFCFGNGAESYQILDKFNGQKLRIDFNPTAVSDDEYRQINRYADITYSGVFSEATNLNGLNNFNTSLGNFKDDIEKIYGPIYKLKSQDTNLEVYQLDKSSKVLYGKDLLFNADGTSNLSSIEDVLGQQVMDGGEYGISTHPDSFDEYGFNSYYTDVKRGVVLKKNFNNGIFEISSQGMRSYFKNLFRENIVSINGHYDQFYDIYILNIQYTKCDSDAICSETWVYSDALNGWLGRLTFTPEDMIRCNGQFYTFKNGDIYKHNIGSVYNTFYGEQSPSIVKFNLNQDPTIRKNHKTIEIDGDDPWDISLLTNLGEGYIDVYDFVKQEGIYRAYIRNLNNEIDTALIGSTQGIGTAIINGNTLEFDYELDPIISVGDKIVNQSLILVGTIVSKTNNSLTLNSISNYTTGGFLICTKPQSIEQNSLLGYYMQVKMTLSSNTISEVFRVGAEVDKSFI